MTADDSQRWPAYLFTEEAPSGMPVKVHLDDRGIIIHARSGLEELVWPFGALHAAPLVTPDLAVVAVFYKYMPEARLEVRSNTFGMALGRYAPQVKASHRSWGHIKLAFLGAVIGVMAWMLFSLWYSHPARFAAGLIPKETRQSLGRTVIASMASQYRVCIAPAGIRSLQKLGHRLTDGVATNADYQITVVNWSLVNAFAAPGGQMLLTHGLIRAAQSPEEVAGVLAHEMGHSIELHPESSIVRALGISAAIDIITGGGGSLSGLGTLLLQNSYARQDERSADEQALRLLERAGISQAGLADFFDRIGRKASKRGSETGSSTIGIDGLFRTHPYPLERAQRVRRSNTYATTPAMSADEWKALREICRRTRPLSEKTGSLQ